MATLFKLLAALIVLTLFYSTIIAISYLYPLDAAANLKGYRQMKLRTLLAILAAGLVVGFILLFYWIRNFAAVTRMTGATRNSIWARFCRLIFASPNS